MAASQKPTTSSPGAKTSNVSDTLRLRRLTGSRVRTTAISSQQPSPMHIEFKVKGNGVSADGNPMAKIRLTKKQQWMPAAQRYAQWKAHVVAALLDSYRGKPEYPAIVRGFGLVGKPLTTKKEWHCHLSVKIHWHDETHGDPEGVFGSIADALFKQDKYLRGTIDFDDEVGGAGSVEIVINLVEL